MRTDLRKYALAMTCGMLGVAVQENASGGESMTRLGRLCGFGYSDGYHACGEDCHQLGENLPPLSYTAQHSLFATSGKTVASRTHHRPATASCDYSSAETWGSPTEDGFTETMSPSMMSSAEPSTPTPLPKPAPIPNRIPKPTPADPEVLDPSSPNDLEIIAPPQPQEIDALLPAMPKRLGGDTPSPPSAIPERSIVEPKKNTTIPERDLLYEGNGLEPQRIEPPKSRVRRNTETRVNPKAAMPLGPQWTSAATQFIR